MDTVPNTDSRLVERQKIGNRALERILAAGLPPVYWTLSPSTGQLNADVVTTVTPVEGSRAVVDAYAKFLGAETVPLGETHVTTGGVYMGCEVRVSGRLPDEPTGGTS